MPSYESTLRAIRKELTEAQAHLSKVTALVRTLGDPDSEPPGLRPGTLRLYSAVEDGILTIDMYLDQLTAKE